MASGISFGRWAAAAMAAALVFFGTAAFVWRDDILRTWLDPKQPFLTYRPPPAPDYATPRAWALIPAKPALWTAADPPADIFFIAPTTFDGGRDWNGPIDDRRADRLLSEVMLPNYAGPFRRTGRLFAPRYRQASLYAFLTNREDAQDARRFAYDDVRRAFDLYLQHYNDGRPILIVGVEQGGGLAARLLSDAVAPDPKLVARLAAAYLIDTVVLAGDYAPGAALPACRSPGEARCVLAFMPVKDDAEAERADRRTLVWSKSGQLESLDGRAPLCVNPIIGRVSDGEASARLNLGAVNATGLELTVRPAFLPRQVSAQCVEGFLHVSSPASPALRASGGWTDRLKAAPFNLFYADEDADAMARVAALIHAPGYRPPTPPAGASIPVLHAPIHHIAERVEASPWGKPPSLRDPRLIGGAAPTRTAHS